MALDVIARCAFSIESDATTNPDQEIIKEGRNLFSFFNPTNWLETLAFTVPVSYFPFIFKWVNPFPDTMYNLWKITNNIMGLREKQGIQGTDFVGRLMELKKDVANNPNVEYHKELNDTIITAQGSIIFAAGFETSANTLSTFCYELATRPDLQDRVYEEVRDVVGSGGKVSHEAIEKMEYLEAAIQENLRINTPVILHTRLCTKDCEVADWLSYLIYMLNLTLIMTQIAPGMKIKKGMLIEMPIWASHHDETFFPDPEEFRPERFFKENVADIIPFTYRPFGGETKNYPK